MDFKLFNRGKILFKDLYIEDVVGLIPQETSSLTQENNSCRVRSRCKAKSNAESLDWPMSLSRIFLNDNGDVFCHETMVR